MKPVYETNEDVSTHDRVMARHGGCCCTCRFRVRLLDHNLFPTKKQVGWACIGFVGWDNENIAYVGNFEHGLCELHTPQEAAQPVQRSEGE